MTLGFLASRCIFVDFAIDGLILAGQPAELQLIEPRATLVRLPGGGFLGSGRSRGHRIVARWGDRRGVGIDTVVEVRARLGSTLAHTITWGEPDGTQRSFDVVSEPPRTQFQRPTSYQPFFVTFRERPA